MPCPVGQVNTLFVLMSGELSYQMLWTWLWSILKLGCQWTFRLMHLKSMWTLHGSLSILRCHKDKAETTEAVMAVRMTNVVGCLVWVRIIWKSPGLGTNAVFETIVPTQWSMSYEGRQLSRTKDWFPQWPFFSELVSNSFDESKSIACFSSSSAIPKGMSRCSCFRLQTSCFETWFLKRKHWSPGTDCGMQGIWQKVLCLFGKANNHGGFLFCHVIMVHVDGPFAFLSDFTPCTVRIFQPRVWCLTGSEVGTQVQHWAAKLWGLGFFSENLFICSTQTVDCGLWLQRLLCRHCRSWDVVANGAMKESKEKDKKGVGLLMREVTYLYL